jgi:hypothetical protein
MPYTNDKNPHSALQLILPKMSYLSPYLTYDDNPLGSHENMIIDQPEENHRISKLFSFAEGN